MRALLRAFSLGMSLLLAALLGAALFLLVSPDYSAAAVVSGSMEPALSVGDLVVIHAEASYRPGDILTFQSQGQWVTHRLVKETKEGLWTQGDANPVPDPQPAAPEQVVGKVVTRVPGIGFVAGYLRTPSGRLALLALGGLLVVFSVFSCKEQLR